MKRILRFLKKKRKKRRKIGKKKKRRKIGKKKEEKKNRKKRKKRRKIGQKRKYVTQRNFLFYQFFTRKILNAVGVSYLS